MSKENFAQLLTEGIYQVRVRENKSVGAIQKELGVALGKKGGSSIEHWRKGFIPSKTQDVTLLSKELVMRGGMDREWLRQFLRSARYAQAVELLGELFPEEVKVGKPPLSQPRPTIRKPRLFTKALTFNNLPQQTTSFIGREDELAKIIDHLLDPVSRLLTLTGPGGMGKTRTALEAAGQLIDKNDVPNPFLHGVCFIPLASLNSADFLVSRIANTLNFAFHETNLEEQLLNYLGGKHMLLILDNFEHLIQESDLINKILRQTSNIKIMATSRERLNLQGEWVIEIGGMAYPQEKGILKPFANGTASLEGRGQLSEEAGTLLATQSFHAIELFSQSARRAHSGFEVVEGNYAAIVQICQLVKGIPLAIELAASWARVLSCQEIATEIEASYEFLATTWRDVPERHRSIQAVFDYSWNLLSDSERQAIQQLSVFHGGFHRKAAMTVSNASLFLLSALVDKSFLYLQSATAERPQATYRMHELLRQYAQEKLKKNAGNYAQVRLDHCQYFAKFLHKRQHLVFSSQQVVVLKEIGSEIENIRLGWQWAVEQGLDSEIHMYLDTLFYFYDIRGWVQEGAEVFRLAGRHLQQKLLTHQSVATKLNWAKVTACQGRYVYRLGRFEEARGLLTQSLRTVHECDSPRDVVFVLNYLAAVAYRLSDFTESVALCEESLEICRLFHYQWETTLALQILGDVADIQGSYEDAKRQHQEALAISQKLDDPRGMAIIQNRLGFTHWRLGEYEEAKRHCEESLETCIEIGDRHGISRAFKNLGNIASDLNDIKQATDYYYQGLQISEEIGDQWGVGAFYNNLAYHLWREGKLVEAREMCLKSVAIWRQLNDQVGVAGSLETLGNIVEAMGKDEEAQACYEEVLQISVEIAVIPFSLDALGGLASLMGNAGNFTRAVEILTFVLHHPATDQETKVRIEDHLAKFTKKLSADAYVAAQVRGQAEDLKALIAEMLPKKDPPPQPVRPGEGFFYYSSESFGE